MITNARITVYDDLESGTATFLLGGQQETIDWRVDRVGEVVLEIPDEWDYLTGNLISQIGKGIQDEM